MAVRDDDTDSKRVFFLFFPFVVCYSQCLFRDPEDKTAKMQHCALTILHSRQTHLMETNICMHSCPFFEKEKTHILPCKLVYVEGNMKLCCGRTQKLTDSIWTQLLEEGLKRTF